MNKLNWLKEEKTLIETFNDREIYKMLKFKMNFGRRVSTKKQNIDRQIKNILRESPNAILKDEKAIGIKWRLEKYLNNF
ncbi:hypothetical protein [Clostridium perfringens]|uniref:hypothetical protein n=1 Tax=Clostridium perfringens TaxID=1502 RepID=UPI0028CDE1B3|nr:hypothetical protein [Clostridium perfringens]MDT7930838.1 hypothetical protein [Clostridium perfringens]MDT7954696.1 hypothetical protein [Clostridium perfringens]